MAPCGWSAGSREVSTCLQKLSKLQRSASLMAFLPHTSINGAGEPHFSTLLVVLHIRIFFPEQGSPVTPVDQAAKQVIFMKLSNHHKRKKTKKSRSLYLTTSQPGRPVCILSSFAFTIFTFALSILWHSFSLRARNVTLPMPVSK